MFSDLYESHKRIEADKKMRSAQNTEPETILRSEPPQRPVVTLSPEAALYYQRTQTYKSANSTADRQIRPAKQVYSTANQKPAEPAKSTMLSRLKHVLGI